ncbi:MAG: DUF192 domain-containing protein [Candidatus Alcyoniella australis]|nr:DUF192 domain-containing protein [Candidatus Alcyoniella australis]
MYRKIPALLILLALTLPQGSLAQGRPPDAVVVIGENEFKVEVVFSPEQRQRGLMEREELCEKCGMLFVFEYTRPLSFWMKNTLLPLSIAYIDKQGIIIDIQQMQPLTLDSHISSGPALMALEVNQGAFKTAGIKVGDKISIRYPNGDIWPR